MKTNILIICLLLTALVACKKEYPRTVLQGRVITQNHNTIIMDPQGTPYNQPIVLTIRRAWSLSSVGGVALIIDTVVLYPPYEYYWEITEEMNELDEYYAAVIESSVPQHAKPTTSKLSTVHHGRENNQADIVLEPRTWLQLHLINEDPQPGDRITLDNILGGGVTYYGPQNNIYTQSGYGHFKTPFTYAVERNGVVTFYVDTIQLLAHDTTFHEIRY
jgi:hypothetical protein